MNIEKFAEEMLVSQSDEQLTDYVLENWSSVLDAMPEKNNDMDTLVDLASQVSKTRGAEELENYKGL